MDPSTDSLPVDELTWAALLGRWLDFARASVALPGDAEGQRWRASVAPIITLQAITFALGQLNGLPEDERALGLDRAEVLLRQESVRLNSDWRGEPMPALLLELINDASLALRTAAFGCCIEWLVVDSPSSPRELPDYRAALGAVDPRSFDGAIHLAWPGTLAVEGELIGFAIGASPRRWWREQHNAAEAAKCALPDLMEALSPVRVRYAMSPRQVYRRIDGQGRIAEDVAAPLTDDPLSGQPLLHCMWEAGRASAPPIDADRWVKQQRAAWPTQRLRFIGASEPDASA